MSEIRRIKVVFKNKACLVKACESLGFIVTARGKKISIDNHGLGRALIVMELQKDGSYMMSGRYDYDEQELKQMEADIRRKYSSLVFSEVAKSLGYFKQSEKNDGKTVQLVYSSF